MFFYIKNNAKRFQMRKKRKRGFSKLIFVSHEAAIARTNLDFTGGGQTEGKGSHLISI